jgi:hypothetical protein
VQKQNKIRKKIIKGKAEQLKNQEKSKLDKQNETRRKENKRQGKFLAIIPYVCLKWLGNADFLPKGFSQVGY